MRAGGSAGRALHQIARPHQEEQTQEPTHLLLAEVLKAAPRKRGGAGGDVTITGRRVSVANRSFWQILMKISIFKYTTYKMNRPAVCCPVWPSGWTVPTRVLHTQLCLCPLIPGCLVQMRTWRHFTCLLHCFFSNALTCTGIEILI